MPACRAPVVEPSEEAQRAAGAVAETHGVENPAGALALAAFLGGGNIGHSSCPVQPPADACSTACSSAVALAAVHRDPMMYNWQYRRFTTLAVQIAQGQHRWDEAGVALPFAAALEAAMPVEVS